MKMTSNKLTVVEDGFEHDLQKVAKELGNAKNQSTEDLRAELNSLYQSIKEGGLLDTNMLTIITEVPKKYPQYNEGLLIKTTHEQAPDRPNILNRMKRIWTSDTFSYSMTAYLETGIDPKKTTHWMPVYEVELIKNPLYDGLRNIVTNMFDMKPEYRDPEIWIFWLEPSSEYVCGVYHQEDVLYRPIETFLRYVQSAKMECKLKDFSQEKLDFIRKDLSELNRSALESLMEWNEQNLLY